MKVYFKLMSVVTLVLLLTIVACSTPPPPVSKDQLQTVQRETLEAEEEANTSTQEREALESELSRKEAELRSLKDHERRLGF